MAEGASTGGSGWSRERLLELATRRFEVVGAGDVDGAMSVLAPEPVFELRPVGLQLRGRDNVRRYYEYMCAHGSASGFTLVDLYFADAAVAYELHLEYGSETFRLMAVMPTDGNRFAGERLFGDERLFRIMFGGPIWSLLTPLGA